MVKYTNDAGKEEDKDLFNLNKRLKDKTNNTRNKLTPDDQDKYQTLHIRDILDL